MLSLLTADLQEILKPSSAGLTLIITVGNDLRGDDGVGPYIYKKSQIPSTKSQTNFKSQISNFQFLDAGDKPENIIDKAVALNPMKTIIIDSANFGGFPGEARIINEERINDVIFSTHMFPLGAVAKIIREDTGSEVILLGVQSRNVGFGEELSEEVEQTAKEIIEACTNCI